MMFSSEPLIKEIFKEDIDSVFSLTSKDDTRKSPAEIEKIFTNLGYSPDMSSFGANSVISRLRREDYNRKWDLRTKDILHGEIYFSFFIIGVFIHNMAHKGNPEVSYAELSGLVIAYNGVKMMGLIRNSTEDVASHPLEIYHDDSFTYTSPAEFLADQNPLAQRSYHKITSHPHCRA